jgi:SAM-dependent methyltransferase
MSWSQKKPKAHSSLKLKEYAEIFDARGRDYHEAMLRFPHARDEEFETILHSAALTDGQIVCDYPAGGGYLEDYIPQKIDLKLLETSHVFLQCAADHSQAERLLVEKGHIPLADNTVDCFISLAGLHHIEDKRDVFAEIYRCLKIGGRIALADVRQDSGVDGFLNDFVHNHSEAGHKGIFLHDNTRIELEYCGYNVTFMQPKRYHWNFATIADMCEYCRLMFGISKATPQEIEAAINQYLSITRHENGVSMGWELLVIVAEK